MTSNFVYILLYVAGRVSIPLRQPCGANPVATATITKHW